VYALSMIGPRLSLVSDWSLVPIMPMNSTGMAGILPGNA
jgi:hypothetical protein